MQFKYFIKIESLENKLRDKEKHYNMHVKRINKKVSELETENERLTALLKSKESAFLSQNSVNNATRLEKTTQTSNSDQRKAKVDETTGIREAESAKERPKLTTAITAHLNMHRYDDRSCLVTFENNFKLMKYSANDYELSSKYFIVF